MPTAAMAGNGGNVTLTAWGGDISLAAGGVVIAAGGGIGADGNSGYGGNGGNGGHGGSITLNAVDRHACSWAMRR